MVLIYWLMFAPERIGIGFAFVLGLLQDIVFGDLLGQSALSMVIMAWIVSRFRLRLRFFPLWQQSLFVGGVLLNDKVVRIWVNGLTGSDFPGWLYWASPVSAIILWPFLFLLLDYLQYKRT